MVVIKNTSFNFLFVMIGILINQPVGKVAHEFGCSTYWMKHCDPDRGSLSDFGNAHNNLTPGFGTFRIDADTVRSLQVSHVERKVIL